MKELEKIVIVGGGYAGLYAAKYISKSQLKKNVELTVISKENFHIWHGFIGEMLTGRILPTQLLSPARRIFKNAKIHVGIAKKIDFKQKKITVVREIDGNKIEVPYDKLIYAAGSKQSNESFEGLFEHGFAIKTWDDCYNLKNHILRMFELASITNDLEERKAMMTFFIAGGGFSGSEIAGELADFATILCKNEFSNLNKEEINVFLAHPGNTILPELFGARVDTRQTKQFPKLVTYAQAHLEKNGVTIKTNTKIKAVSKNLVLLDDGTKLPTRTVISAVGTIAQPLTVDSGFPLSKNGKILTDRTLQVKGLKNVWACGDCAYIIHPNGGQVPSTAWWGMMAGRHIAKNILRLSKNKIQLKFNKKGFGQAVSIGKRTAVGEIWGIPFKGTLAWLLWRSVLFYYFPFSDRKLRLLLDWLIWPFFGRDIVEMSLDDTDHFDVRKVKFQPGDFIFSKGRHSHNIYFILNGKVSILSNGNKEKEIKNQMLSYKNEDLIANTLVEGYEFKDEQFTELSSIFQLINLQK